MLPAAWLAPVERVTQAQMWTACSCMFACAAALRRIHFASTRHSSTLVPYVRSYVVCRGTGCCVRLCLAEIAVPGRFFPLPATTGQGRGGVDKQACGCSQRLQRLPCICTHT
jgi:hypothetical protein